MTEWTILWEARALFLDGLLATLGLFALSIICAFVLGCAWVFLLEERNRLSIVVRGWINLMRTLPFLILAYLLYYGLPELGLRMSAWTAGLMAPRIGSPTCSMNTSWVAAVPPCMPSSTTTSAPALTASAVS